MDTNTDHVTPLELRMRSTKYDWLPTVFGTSIFTSFI